MYAALADCVVMCSEERKKSAPPALTRGEPHSGMTKAKRQDELSLATVPVRWGILGAANIAIHKVVPAMQLGTHTPVVAIASLLVSEPSPPAAACERSRSSHPDRPRATAQACPTVGPFGSGVARLALRR